MLSTQMAQQSLRKIALQNPAYRFVAPAALTASRAFQPQRRLIASQSVSEQTAAHEILAKQRLHRPVSPHLGIYQPQITWYLSMLNRITGVALGGGLYVFGIAYLVAPTLGWHLESAVMAASFAAWPLALKFATKLVVALPFTFHSLNGLRHLVWDTASMITNKQVNATGWTVVALSVLSALGLALI